MRVIAGGASVRPAEGQGWGWAPRRLQLGCRLLDAGGVRRGHPRGGLPLPTFRTPHPAPSRPGPPGPGSGKTRVVAARITELLRRGERPGSVLAITFTNKAANELKERVQALVGAGDAGLARLRVTTFHALCAALLGCARAGGGVPGNGTGEGPWSGRALECGGWARARGQTGMCAAPRRPRMPPAACGGCLQPRARAHVTPPRPQRPQAVQRHAPARARAGKVCDLRPARRHQLPDARARLGRRPADLEARGARGARPDQRAEEPQRSRVQVGAWGCLGTAAHQPRNRKAGLTRLGPRTPPGTRRPVFPRGQAALTRWASPYPNCARAAPTWAAGPARPAAATCSRPCGGRAPCRGALNCRRPQRASSQSGGRPAWLGGGARVRRVARTCLRAA